MKILAIETSFDETAAAVVENGTNALSSIVSSSVLLHKQFGGVLPELAARKQLDFILPAITEALIHAFPQPMDTFSLKECIETNIDAIAVTDGPGLIGSLLIGVEAAKTLAYIAHKPIIPVNHVYAHIFANFVSLETLPSFPAIALVVSGGHTELFSMESPTNMTWIAGTIDDAAGEAFDKTARLLGFENKGGVAIEAAANQYIQANSGFSISLPRPLLHDDTLNFSFSGLKTAVLKEWKKYPEHSHQEISAFSYEIQESITDVLVKKTLKAAEKYSALSLFVSGGVAANQRLRDKFLTSLQHINYSHMQVFFPSKNLCTDNAVSIGAAAFFLNNVQDWRVITAIPNLTIEK